MLTRKTYTGEDLPKSQKSEIELLDLVQGRLIAEIREIITTKENGIMNFDLTTKKGQKEARNI